MFVTRLVRRARSASTSRLLVALTACLVGAGALAAIAIAATSGGPVPAPKPLADALHDALTAPPADGITARIAFTNRLIDSSAVQGSDPLLSGATGRLWLGSGRRFRLELQSDRGDVQVVSDGTTLGVYDPGMDVAYRIALPRRRGDAATRNPNDRPPSVAQVRDDLAKLMQHANLTGAQPTDVAGRPAYDVRVSPQRDGGLVGAAELAWDAVNGVPLRVAIYAKGDQTPVLELEATDIAYGPVDASVFDVPPPQGVKVTTLRAHAPAHGGATHRHARDLAAPSAPSAPSAPDTLAGMARDTIRPVGVSKRPGFLVTYGRGLGGLAVLEIPGAPSTARIPAAHDGEGPGLALPTADVNGATAQVLPTALGTIVRFTRDGVTYVVAGSVPQSVAEAAARGL